MSKGKALLLWCYDGRLLKEWYHRFELEMKYRIEMMLEREVMLRKKCEIRSDGRK